MTQKWEYEVVYATGTFIDKWEDEKIDLEAYLNKKGKEGWQLVQGPSFNFNHCIFKRPLNSSTP